jgi:putative transferase (TIGR04331 family)
VFLATTSIDSFWDKEQNIIFAGEWCKLQEAKGKWQDLNTRTFPYHWSNVRDMDTGIVNIDQIYKKSISSLTVFLNKYLGIEKDERYYSIVLGHWLIRFLHTNMDKYKLLTDICKQYPSELNTFVIPSVEYIVPLDENEYHELIATDRYNLQEYSSLSKFLKIEFKEFSTYKKQNKVGVYKTKTSFKKSLKRYCFSFLNFLKSNEVCITDPYFLNTQSYIDVWRKSRNIIFNDFNFDLEFEFNFDKFARKSVLDVHATTEFEKYISENILKNMPMIFLEGHSKTQCIISSKKIPLSKIYYNSNAIQTNMLYKFFIASVYQNVELVTHQHGAGYGVDYECCDEKYERCVSDKFFTFGWSDNKSACYLPSSVLNHKSIDANNSVLFVLTGGTRYIRRLFYMPKSTQLLENTVNSAVKFLKRASDKSIQLRFYSESNGWGVRSRVYEKTDLFTEDLGKFHTSFNSSRLIILEHLGTTFYQAMAINKPVIVFINQDIYKFRKEAVEYFMKLEEVGILHYSPESAFQHYASIKNNTDNWWNDITLQDIRREFSHNFARSADNWSSDFVNGLDSCL